MFYYLLKDNKTLVMISAVKSLNANFKFDISENISDMSNPDTNRLKTLRDKIAPMVSEFYPEFTNRIWGI